MNDTFLTTEEIAEVEPLGEYFGRCRGLICAGRRWIPIADAKSFAPLAGKYAIDDKHIYFGEGSYWRIVNSPLHWGIEIPSIVDRMTFQVIADDFAIDQSHVYWRCDILVGIVPQDFCPISEHFARYENKVLYFYSGIHKSVVGDDGDYKGILPITLQGATPSSFRSLGGLYGRDDTNLYYHSTLVSSEGVATTKALTPELVKTDQEVFFQGTVVEGADASTFETLGNSRFCRDSRQVYFIGCGGDDEWLNPIEGADTATFKLLEESGYACDRKHVYGPRYGEEYCGVEVLDGQDPATFVAPD